MTDDDPKPDWVNHKGHKVPDELVPEMDKLIEETVHGIRRHAEELMSRIARFRGHSFDDIGALRELLAEKYGAKRGGVKGNVSFVAFDGCTKVEVRVADNVVFGPELSVAKGLIDAYIEEVSEGASAPVRALLEHAFETDRPGHVNRANLHALRRLAIDHPTWKEAMVALGDSMRVMGSKEYFQISVRERPTDGWKALPINLANAVEVPHG